jgi:GT2 family glycosyltransferase
MVPTARQNPAIVVLGMMTQHPVPGVIWQTIHYLFGFKRLGYEVQYAEVHFRPRHVFHDSTADAVEFLDRLMRRLGLGGQWAYHAIHENGACYGMSIERLRRCYREAELVINLHAATIPLPEHYAGGRLVCLETDPVQVQVELSENDRDAIEFLKPHMAFFTFAENYGNSDCRLPQSDLFDFHPTRQPVLLDLWEHQTAQTATAFRTVANWRQTGRDLVFHGTHYTWSKHHEFLKFLELPRLTGQRFEPALAKIDEPEKALLDRHGWTVGDALAFGQDIDAYRAFVQGAQGEFSVAKDQNIRLRTGWFSDRSATFLASARPVIVQDTGFGCSLPTGEGLLPFLTPEEAVDAVARVAAEPDRHQRAASALAREYFGHDVVLGRLLDDLGMRPPTRGAPAPAPLISAPRDHSALPHWLVLEPVQRNPVELEPVTLEAVMALSPPRPLSALAPSAHRRPGASVIVPVRDGLVFTRMCLASVLADDLVPLELIVIDNGSASDTHAYLSDLAESNPHVQVVHNQHNRSFAAAINQGLTVADSPLIVLLNNDTIVTPGWLEGLAQHLEDPAVGLLNPVTNRAPNEAVIDASYRTYGELLELAAARRRSRPGRSLELRTATMFCLAMTREVGVRLGHLDERYQVGLFEDDDYSLRASEAGLQVMCAEDVFVHHFGTASFGALISSGEYASLFDANRRRFEAKWGRDWEPHARRPSVAWQRQAEGLRRLVAERVPRDAVVLIVNRGDQSLLDLEGRRALPFPCDEDGVYAGHYPAGGAEAIELLEAMRARGATHFVLPAGELWWLEHYAELHAHLDGCHRLLASTDAGIAYTLSTEH